MNLTKNWIEKQITEYKIFLSHLSDTDITNERLKIRYSATLNTLQSTLEVVKIELGEIKC